jgi:demethylmenaquinone methyltransferase/2-methoxy-6-polyprenyl-1,4-benzoquinol methylase
MGRVDAPSKEPARIAGMFDAIADRYDFLNRTLSGGFDRGWRRRALAALDLTGHERLLDICTGTADIPLAARRDGRAAEVVGVDFSTEMLRVGVEKIRKAGKKASVHLVRADATRLPLADESFDAATIAFGIRNVERPREACAEMSRVVRRGGRIAILEFGMPRQVLLRRLYNWYFTQLLPRIGAAVSGHQSAYSYLPLSVGAFPPPAEFCSLLTSCGFGDVQARPLTSGIVYLYTGRKR